MTPRAVLVLLVACKTAEQAPAERSPAPCANDKVRFTIAGEHACASVPLVLGHGTGDDGRVDIGKDLFFDRGPARTPRRYLDDYPDDRPLGVTISPQFDTRDGYRYTLFFGIGGLRKREWIAPITKQVVPGSHSYVFARSPERVGAYVQLSRDIPDAHGVPTNSRTYVSKSGTVTFQTIDLPGRRYSGHVELEFERTGPIAPDDGPDIVEVKGDFDLRE